MMKSAATVALGLPTSDSLKRPESDVLISSSLSETSEARDAPEEELSVEVGHLPRTRIVEGVSSARLSDLQRSGPTSMVSMSMTVMSLKPTTEEERGRVGQTIRSSTAQHHPPTESDSLSKAQGRGGVGGEGGTNS